ncbi:hypothetical protein BaOVIS_008170 [Babesia ovis]|uniref:Uncharacterized protein n=1 Tax=Babesia ovis TaxID=5869 RepID=A0A9W5WU05_BABOV|nr:hypothetical protein BaOVIS_008170 [Babesia ovis]
MVRRANSDIISFTNTDADGRRRLLPSLLPGKTARKSDGWLRSDIVSSLWRRSEQASDSVSSGDIALRTKKGADRLKAAFNGAYWFKSKNVESLELSDDEDSSPTEEREYTAYTTVLYNKLSSMFDGFKGMMYSNWHLTRTIGNSSSGGFSISSNGVSAITQKFHYTMDSLLGRTGSSERFVAFIPTFSSGKSGFNFSNTFIPDHDHFVDCFALFIEGTSNEDVQTPTLQRTESIVDVSDNLRCEIVHKESQQVISKHGPYQCVYEEEIDSETQDKPLKEFIEEMPVNNGRLRFFQAIRSLRKQYDKSPDTLESRSTNGDSTDAQESGSSTATSYFRNRLAMLSDYLSKRSEESRASNSLRSYFTSLKPKRQEENEDVSCYGDSADYRMKEHTRIHTSHWDEFQYDNIEIVLRDSDDNSIIQLPYGCAVM